MVPGLLGVSRPRPTDPRKKLAYVSYYAGGFCVLKYGPQGLRQVGAFIDEGGTRNPLDVAVYPDPRQDRPSEPGTTATVMVRRESGVRTTFSCQRNRSGRRPVPP
jgi:hypothetical protein